MITRLYIEHFKSINHLELNFRDKVIFVGPNSAGKSNIIDAIRFVKDAVTFDLDRAVSERHGVDSIRQWSPFKPFHVTIKLNIEDRNGYGFFSLTLSSSAGHYRIIREEGSWSETVYLMGGDQEPDEEPSLETTSYIRGKNGEVKLRYEKNNDLVRTNDYEMEDRDALFIQFLRSPIRGVPLRNLFGLRRSVTSFEAYSIFPNTLRMPQTPSNELRLAPTGSNLTSVFKYMTRTRGRDGSRSEVLSALQLLMPRLENIAVQSLGGLSVPTFRIREPNDKAHDFNVSQLSDGTLRVFGILVALYQPHGPDVIALEEPEQTVNPGVLGVLADAVKEVSKRRQVMITTHSPHLVDYFEPETIIAVDVVDGVTVAGPVRRDQRDAVRDRLFSLGEIMTIEGLEAEPA